MKDKPVADREKFMPLLSPWTDAAKIPWALIEPHEKQAMKNHGQTLERLRERHGLSPCEAVAILEDRPWRKMAPADSIARLYEIIIDHRRALATQQPSDAEPIEESLLAFAVWLDEQFSKKDCAVTLLDDPADWVIAYRASQKSGV